MKKNVLLLLLLSTFIFLLLFYSSCSNLTSGAMETINSEMIGDDLSKLYARFPKTRTLGIRWNKHKGATGMIEPVFPGTLSVDNVSVSDPCVIKAGTGDYRMWFTKIEVEANNGLELKKYSIGYAVSSDGINWTDRTGANVPQVSDELRGGIRICSLIVTDNPTHKYRIWYLGKSSTLNDSGWKLYYAYSRSIDDHDNISWKIQRFAMLYQALESTPDEFDCVDIGRASVINDGQLGFKMWYSGTNGYVGKIGYALSHEGKYKWSKQYDIMGPGFAGANGFDIGAVDYPYIIKDQGIYKMFYSGYNTPWEIGLAYSLDGRTFVYYDEQFPDGDNDSVLKPEAFWEGRGILNGCVIKDTVDDTVVYKIWYTAQGNDDIYRIGYAESYE